MSEPIINSRLQGGPCDGERFYVSHGQMKLMVPDRTPLTMRWDAAPSDTINLHLYEARPFRCSERAFGQQLYLMFCHPTLSHQDALERAKEWIGD